jgi:hypothetical protein
MQVLQEHSPAATLVRSEKGVTFSDLSPPPAAGYFHVPGAALD